MAIETQITHAERKIQNAEKISEEVKRDSAKEQQHYDQLKRNLAEVKKAADAAASECMISDLTRRLIKTPESHEKSAQAGFKLTERHLEEYQGL